MCFPSIDGDELELLINITLPDSKLWFSNVMCNLSLNSIFVILFIFEKRSIWSLLYKLFELTGNLKNPLIFICSSSVNIFSSVSNSPVSSFIEVSLYLWPLIANLFSQLNLSELNWRNTSVLSFTLIFIPFFISLL